MLSPFFWVLISLYFALFSRYPRRAQRGKTTAVVLLLFFSNSVIYKEFCRKWEVFGVPIEQVGTYDVGIVLGGMAEYNSDLKTLSMRRGGDRIWQTITLYKTGHIQKILISGDHGYLIDRGLHEAQQLKSVLVQWGIPSSDILIEAFSKNTFENAVESKKILSKSLPNAKQFLLITSGRHMLRARACFAKAGLKCDQFSTDLYTGPKRFYTLEDYLLPDVSVMADWQGLIKEYVGTIAYKMTGKL